jgi:hypothetical protein
VVTWLEGTTVIGQDEIESGRPSSLDGLSVRLVGHAPVVELNGQDATGKPVTFQSGESSQGSRSQIQVPFASTADQPFVFVSSHDLVLQLAHITPCETGTSAAGEPAAREPAAGMPALHLALLGDGGLASQQTGPLVDGDTASLEALEIQVSLSYQPLLQVDYHPAMGLVLGAATLAGLSLAAGWLLGPQMVWLRLDHTASGTTVIRLNPNPGSRDSRWLRNLIGYLNEAVGHDD